MSSTVFVPRKEPALSHSPLLKRAKCLRSGVKMTPFATPWLGQSCSSLPVATFQILVFFELCTTTNSPFPASSMVCNQLESAITFHAAKRRPCSKSHHSSRPPSLVLSDQP